MASAVAIALVRGFQARLARCRIPPGWAYGRPLRSDVRFGLHRFELRNHLALLNAIAFDDQNLRDTRGANRIGAKVDVVARFDFA